MRMREKNGKSKANYKLNIMIAILDDLTWYDKIQVPISIFPQMRRRKLSFGIHFILFYFGCIGWSRNGNEGKLRPKPNSKLERNSQSHKETSWVELSLISFEIILTKVRKVRECIDINLTETEPNSSSSELLVSSTKFIWREGVFGC